MIVNEDNHVLVREKLNGSVLYYYGMKKMYQWGKLLANTEKKWNVAIQRFCTIKVTKKKLLYQS